ncbi:MAG TPA: GNAT family N-acetyltransferase [Candidatus Paceibacterota bacterium]
MQEQDISPSAWVHKVAFPRQMHSEEWLRCNFAAFPRMQYFVAEMSNNVIGYILWVQKSGFRQNVVLELEQIAILPFFQGRGFAAILISQSLMEVKKHLAERRAVVKSIIVTTRTDNQAQRLYAKVLGAKAEAVIKGLYSSDEVIMIARNI